MTRRYNNENKEAVQKYYNKLINNISSIIESYSNIYTQEELDLLKKSRILLSNMYDSFSLDGSDKLHMDRLQEVFKIEDELKDLIFKAWIYEENNGYNFISWLKDDKYQEGKTLVFATFSNNYDESFCESSIGIKYKVDSKGFIGASEIDGATILLNSDETSLYTIANIDGKSINFYNTATKIPSPKLITGCVNNKYQSKHNEIILDSRFIKPVEVICLSEASYSIASALADKLGIPLKYQSKSNKM